MLGVEQVDGLDVAEDGGDEVGGEHVLGPVLLVHAEVENLQQRISFISEVFRTENLVNIRDTLKAARFNSSY